MAKVRLGSIIVNPVSRGVLEVVVKAMSNGSIDPEAIGAAWPCRIDGEERQALLVDREGVSTLATDSGLIRVEEKVRRASGTDTFQLGDYQVGFYWPVHEREFVERLRTLGRLDPSSHFPDITVSTGSPNRSRRTKRQTQ